MKYGVLLAVILIGVPTSVTANDDLFFRSWFGYCMPGVPGACAGASLRLEYLGALASGGRGATSTRATVYFTNLQGVAGGLGTSPFSMRSFDFEGLGWTESSLSFDATIGPPYSTGPGTLWTTEVLIARAWGRDATPTIALFGQNSARLHGCDTPTVVYSHDGQVCNQVQSHVSVLPGRWEFTPSSTLTIRGYAGTAATLSECTVGRTCVGVPEPGSLLLLVTGALGLGIVAGRRRYASSRT